MSLHINYERGQQVLQRLQQAFTAREGLLSTTDDLVESQIPTGVELLSRDHALFLFGSVTLKC